MSGGISGFRPIEGPDSSELDQTSDAGAAEQPIESRVVRNGVGPRLDASMVASLDTQLLQSQLMASGDTKTEAKREAKVIVATATEIEDLKSQLADLEGLESMYEEMLADPNLDSWDAAWLEWDLWDVRTEIYDLKQQLGELEGSFDQLIGEAWGALSNIFGLTDELTKYEGQKVDESSKKTAEEIERKKRTKAKTTQLDSENNKRLTDLRERGILPPTPPASLAVRKQLEKVKKKVETGTKDRATFDEVRKAVKSVRGAVAGKRA